MLSGFIFAWISFSKWERKKAAYLPNVLLCLERNKYSFVTLTHQLSGLSLRCLLPGTVQGTLCSCLEATQSSPQLTE